MNLLNKNNILLAQLKWVIKFSVFKNFLILIVLLSSSIGYALQFDTLEDSGVESGSGSEEVKEIEISKNDINKLIESYKQGIETPLVKSAAEILGKNPNHKLALNLLGIFYSKKGKGGLAKIIYNRAIASHKNEPAFYNNLAIIFMDEGDLKTAISYFRKSMELSPKYIIGATNLASIYLEFKDYNRALTPLEIGFDQLKGEISKGKEELIGVANNLAVALSHQGNFKKSQSIYESILKIDSRNLTILMNYAILLIEKIKDSDEGLKILSKINFISNDSEINKKAKQLEEKAKKMEQSE